MIEIQPFQPKDQDPVQRLILAGLKEYWGFIDNSKNPDLKDISASYRDGTFLVAWQDDDVVGTGAFLPRSNETVEVVRMSVARHLRSRGIGRQLLSELCRRAYQSGYRRVILETTETWERAIAFYKNFGFKITHYLDGDIYFALDLRHEHK